MNSLVSLIVPVYNAMPYLKDHLKSIEEQTWRPIECIFVDDGSTDDSLACLRENASKLEKTGISVVVLPISHGGQAKAVDIALKKATGEFLTWCDADDIMLPRCIEAKAAYLIDHPEIGIVRNDGLVFDGDQGTVIAHSTKEADRKNQWIFEELLRQTTYCFAGCYMVRMSVFDECYPDRSIPISKEGQNLQLLLPPASRSICGYIPEVLHYYFRRNSGHSSQKRSYTQMLQRKMGFISLYEAILPYCDCDKEYYHQVIEELKIQYLEEVRFSLIQQVKREMKKT